MFFFWQRQSVYTKSFFIKILLNKLYCNLATKLNISRKKFDINIDDDIIVIQYIVRKFNNSENLFSKLRKVNGLKIFTILSMIYTKIVNNHENEIINNKTIKNPGFIRSLLHAFKNNGKDNNLHTITNTTLTTTTTKNKANLDDNDKTRNLILQVLK